MIKNPRFQSQLEIWRQAKPISEGNFAWKTKATNGQKLNLRRKDQQEITRSYKTHSTEIRTKIHQDKSDVSWYKGKFTWWNRDRTKETRKTEKIGKKINC